MSVWDERQGRRDGGSVRCLSCRQVYDKPMQGGTTSRNPGCPRCGYVGWLSVLAASVVEATPLYGSTRAP